MKPRIYYLVPDSDAPSWGIGLLYHHVRLLRELGFEARVLHHQASFGLTWLDVEVPIRYVDDASFQPGATDIVVIPEVLARTADLASLPPRRVVFVQGSFLILSRGEEAFDYRDLGFEAALAVLPHVRDIVSRHYGLVPAVVPPFIAPYFFAGEAELERRRDRRVLLVGKPEYLQAGYLDYEIARKLLQRHFGRLETRGEGPWELVELVGRSHRQVAELMRRSEYLINLNTLEAFNTTVPEAMAAGCVPICYEAYGGRDFLEAGRNAYVFQNNYIYPLVEKVLELTERRDELADQLGEIRRAGWTTAGRYQEKDTARALDAFYTRLLA